MRRFGRRLGRRLGPVLRDAWQLAKPYFLSDEKWVAWSMLAGTVFLNLTIVGLGVINTYWFNAFYNALQNKNVTAFWKLLLIGQKSPNYPPIGIMPGFTLFAVVWILAAVYQSYINQWLQIRWRRFFTDRMMGQWLTDQAFYHIALTAPTDGTGTDNPDQRIAQDIDLYITYTMTLGLDLLANIVTVFSYVGVLWSLSGTFHLFGVTMNGYLVWCAVLNAIVANYVMHLIGRPLIKLSFVQQKFEANFRFHLARMREHTEAIALYRGEPVEKTALQSHFKAIIGNYMHIIRRTKGVNAFSNTNDLLGQVVPFIIAGPRYFLGAMNLGQLMQVVSAYGRLQGSLSWLSSAGTYTSIATWAATVERLATFQRAIEAAHEHQGGFAQAHGTAPALDDVSIDLPDGTELLKDTSLAFTPGRSVAIQGVSGSGKSTLFRALAGIWPFGSGKITTPTGKPMFLPQRPYFPLGTLRQALAYPADPENFSKAALTQALQDVGLGQMADQLDETAIWSQRLSIARALLNQPEWLFLDEATSALDLASDTALQAVLKEKLPNTTRISISHDPLPADEHITLENGQLSVATA
jgi:putative ATP-binding cassette transporter